MVNYQLGKIYKLISPSGLIYIGSTCEILSKRLGGHKGDYKYYQKHKNRHFISSFILFEEDIDNIDIVLIENYPCNSKDELRARERYYIDSLKCVNKNKPFLIQEDFKEYNKKFCKKYYEKNKEYFFQKHKKYYEKNKEKIKEYNKEYREKRKKIKEDNITL